jgi:hypothetical protein
MCVCFREVLNSCKNGSHARTRQGHLPVRSALQALRPAVDEDDQRRGQGPDLQAGQEGAHPLPDRCHSQGFPRCGPGKLLPALDARFSLYSTQGKENVNLRCGCFRFRKLLIVR